MATELDQSLFEFLDAFDDPYVPNGVWQGMIEEGVRVWNELNETDHDPFDTLIAYVAAKASNPHPLIGHMNESRLR